LSKPTKPKPRKKESPKDAIAKIAAENRAHFERLDAKAKAQESESSTGEINLRPRPHARQPLRLSVQPSRTSPVSTGFVCPHCQQVCAVSADLIGSDVSCPHCSNVFNATANNPTPRPATLVQPPPRVTNHAATRSGNLTAEQVASLEHSLRTTLNQVVIQDIRLVHLGGPKYKAHLTIMTAHGNAQWVADVNYQGNNFVWQLVDESAKGTAGFRLVGLITLLICGWMWFLTFDKYHNGELVTTTTKYLLALRVTDPPGSPEIVAVQRQLNALKWKEFFIESGWAFGGLVGLVQLCMGRHFADLPWLRIFIGWGLGFAVGLIQRL
jgi:hypothetical protein